MRKCRLHFVEIKKKSNICFCYWILQLHFVVLQSENQKVFVSLPHIKYSQWNIECVSRFKQKHSSCWHLHNHIKQPHYLHIENFAPITSMPARVVWKILKQWKRIYGLAVMCHKACHSEMRKPALWNDTYLWYREWLVRDNILFQARHQACQVCALFSY